MDCHLICTRGKSQLCLATMEQVRKCDWFIVASGLKLCAYYLPIGHLKNVCILWPFLVSEGTINRGMPIREFAPIIQQCLTICPIIQKCLDLGAIVLHFSSLFIFTSSKPDQSIITSNMSIRCLFLWCPYFGSYEGNCTSYRGIHSATNMLSCPQS